MSKFKGLLAVLAALCVVAFAGRVEASHFRYGNITYTIPDPVFAPRTVRFDVVTAWRDPTTTPIPSFEYGDGQTVTSAIGPLVATLVDAAGLKYSIHRLTVSHTYAGAGPYTAKIDSNARISNLINSANSNYEVRALVDLSEGNTGNPVTVLPGIIQLQVNGVRKIQIPAVDPDGTPVTCRFATSAESSVTTNPPVIPGGAALAIAPSSDPPGCTLTWNTAGAVSGQQFATQVVMESVNALNPAVKSSAAVDFIIEMVQSPVPTCTGTASYVVDMGKTLTTSFIGTTVGGGALKMESIGSIGLINPTPGTTLFSPFTSTFTWSPNIGEEGTHVLAVVYTNSFNISGFCTLTVTVPECAQFGQPCSAGTGACTSTGIQQCNGPAVECTAVEKDPLPEICNGIDDDCNNTIDDNNPEAGQSCTTGLSQVCSAGLTTCNAGVIECVPEVAPGTFPETCNGVDDDCDSSVDEGFNVGAVCVVGVGGCEDGGLIVCDGMGGSVCNAVSDPPEAEICDGADNDCNGVADDGLGLGVACTSGVGACAQSGLTACDGMGGVGCDAVPGTPSPEVCGDSTDNNCDGVVDDGCGDADGDGLNDALETTLGSDPDDTDSDDDGVIDGDEPLFGEDSDGDGLPNVLDPDSDDDGLFDGTEVGANCNDPDTNATLGHCRPDGDAGQTGTNPLNPDSDGDGKSDGSEDNNLNGVVDLNEGNPENFNDGSTTKDFDGDGLGDALELLLGTNDKDADSDEDGLLDGDEANPSDDADGDGLVNPLDVDSDNDALFDGTEAGKGCQHPATNQVFGHCRPDGDLGGTKTSPVARDTDRGGVIDGAEDTNLNGVFNMGELDPKKASDDPGVVDGDGDGLSDALENALDTNPSDADSDDDGLPDGAEPNPSDDGDGDGAMNVVDFDADDDGLIDGTEAGRACTGEGTDPAAMKCIADADGGATKTFVLVADTDGGSKSDGAEDTNHNGTVDPGETNPLFPGDDVEQPECTTDADCGDASSGLICTEQGCGAGCRGTDGNGCPSGQVCTSETNAAGQCQPERPDDEPGPPTNPEGCGCRTAPSQGGALPLGFALVAGLVLATRRRRAA